jgi:hypothetical protein
MYASGKMEGIKSLFYITEIYTSGKMEGIKSLFYITELLARK